MIINRKTTLKLALLLGGASFAIATPIVANHGNGLRGAHQAPASYGVQYAGGYGEDYYAAPQTSAPTYQNQAYFSGHEVGGGYVAPQTYETTYATSYVSAAPQVPVGDYGMHGLRGASSTWDHGISLGGGVVRTNAKHTERMLDWQENTTGKAISLLANRQNGTLAPNSLTVGGGIKGAFMWQKTSDAGKFPILSRFPDFTQGTETSSGVFAINNAALAFTGTFGDWTTIYMQPEYSETEFFGQDEMQLRKAFVVLGNLDKTPFYLAFGRKTIDFGNFDGYNPFVQTEAQHYFHAVSDHPVLEVGYYDHGFKLTASAFSGGRQLRVAYAGEENNNKIANYAASIEKEFILGRNSAFTVGASYLHDTSYRNNYTAHTFSLIQSGTPPANFISYRNGAVDAFAEYNSSWLDLMFEYTTTLKPWAAAIPQDANGIVNPAYIIDPLGSPNDLDNISFDQRLEVFTGQVRVKPMLPNGKRLAISAVGSWGNIGDDFVGSAFGQPTSWKKNQQHAVGIEYPISDYLDLGAEYVYNKGFIPFVGPQLVSSNDTEAHAVHVGFKARF